MMDQEPCTLQNIPGSFPNTPMKQRLGITSILGRKSLLPGAVEL